VPRTPSRLQPRLHRTRGGASKFIHYQSLKSLREYVVVSHRERPVDHHRRLDSGQWLATAYTDEDADIELATLSGGIRLADVYDKVDFDERESESVRADKSRVAR
jgi:Uma2 family endonuclease